MQNKPNRIFHPTEKQEKNRKTLQKELTEGGWMAEKDCNAHFVLMSLRQFSQIIFLKQNFVLFLLFAATNSFNCCLCCLRIDKN